MVFRYSKRARTFFCLKWVGLIFTIPNSPVIHSDIFVRRGLAGDKSGETSHGNIAVYVLVSWELTFCLINVWVRKRYRNR